MRVFAKMANELTSLRNINRGIERKSLTTARTRMYLCQKVETHEKYSGDTLVYQRKTEAHEPWRAVVWETRSDGKWQSGRTRVASGALNFLWNLLTIKYEPVRSVILNFRMGPARLRNPFHSWGASAIRPLSRRARKTSFAGYINHLPERGI